ncbi:2-amino-4-hydroxy-6-hydroxymethyldihydropteridine diphosphokinase [Paenibacillus campi]|uniref:2-amino-4-hydroxy-6- hydroxymethyldihydropteridine diphosphokinase n=1 Tax=Paenibacillus campi TaxID=3106031 RepID=UPI002AFE5110|nr:2-amino-4-hydroxy-6-hydroxymethyldihydropteridine diphosphokinase [Paenibacillus sp. SGZ-1009]
MINYSHSSGSSEAYIALGANLGDREQTLYDAIELLHSHPQIAVQRCSGVYDTAPVGYTDQPAFYNMVIRISTTLQPLELLDIMLEIESQLGRVRTIRWGPRTVDLDLLWMDHRHIETERLQLPHPRMCERAFVLVPLHELIRQTEVPELYTLVNDAIQHVQDQPIHYVHACSLSLPAKWN